MKQIHIISLGTSIITNYSRKVKELPPVSEDKKFKQALVEPLLNYVESNPYEASAELNALKEFLEKKDVHEVHFILTETNVSRICGKVLEKYLRSLGIKVSGKKPIPGYYSESPDDYDRAAENFVEGLGKLRDNLIDYIRSKRKETATEVLINATGGFKPEVVILSLVGSLTGCRVYYIHEFFKRAIFLPPVFLAIPGKLEIKMLKEIYQRKDKRIILPILKDFQEKFKDIIPGAIHLGLVSVKVDERNTVYEVSLNPYGKFIYETYKKLWENEES